LDTGSPFDTHYEPSLPITLEELKDVPASNKVVAKWPDGHAAELAEMKAGKLRKLLELKRAIKSEAVIPPLNTGEIPRNHHKIEVLQKGDRRLLMIITEQERQICQVVVDRFGEIPGDGRNKVPNDTPAIQKCYSWLKPLVEKYQSGEITGTKLLKKARDEKLVADGIEKSTTLSKRKVLDATPKKDEIKEEPAEDGGGDSSKPPKMARTTPAGTKGTKRRLWGKTPPKKKKKGKDRHAGTCEK
jgi:hypothetical protein